MGICKFVKIQNCQNLQEIIIELHFQTFYLAGRAYFDTYMNYFLNISKEIQKCKEAQMIDKSNILPFYLKYC